MNEKLCRSHYPIVVTSNVRLNEFRLCNAGYSITDPPTLVEPADCDRCDEVTTQQDQSVNAVIARNPRYW